MLAVTEKHDAMQRAVAQQGAYDAVLLHQHVPFRTQRGALAHGLLDRVLRPFSERADVLGRSRRGAMRQHLAKQRLDFSRDQERTGEGAHLFDIGLEVAARDHRKPERGDPLLVGIHLVAVKLAAALNEVRCLLVSEHSLAECAQADLADQ